MVVEALLVRSGLPRLEALLLLAHASGRRREQLLAGSDPLADEAVRAFVALSARRIAGEPIAYLVGHREFYGRRFDVGPGVLIPRPETELLVDLALAWIDARRATAGERLRVLDLGTGSGAVAITLALERPGRLHVTATDRTDAALARAAANAKRLDADIRFVAGDWFAALAGAGAPDPKTFDVILSNPPYVAADDPHLGEGDLRFEPAEALTDFADGLGALRAITTGAPRHLAPGGALMMEHGYDQAAAVRGLLEAAGFADVASARDLAGLERATHGRFGRPAHGADTAVL